MAAAKNLAALTSIRFLAALRVAMFHFLDWDTSGYWWRGLMSTPSSVSYFFVSSGFLLTYTYGARFDRDEVPYGKFWLGRAVRLLPVYYLGLLVAFPILLHTHQFSLGKVLLTVFLLQSWDPRTALYWNFPAWALSDLAFCYFTLPFLLRATRSLSRDMWFALAAVAWLISLTMSLTYLWLNPDGLTHISSASRAFWLNVLKYNPIIHIPEFFIGMLAGRLFNKHGAFSNKKSNLTFLLSAAAILIILLWGYHIPYPVTHTGMLAPLLAVLICSIASGGLAARALQAKWFVVLGQSSFALYMVHAPLWGLIQWASGSEASLEQHREACSVRRDSGRLGRAI
jgi:peptidoglycan/LPS O-acetylase OafA/YrhL